MARILVTGGTGYIGSHTCVELLEQGHEVVGESSQIPLEYYDNNIAGTVNLLQVMAEFDCKNTIFGSSAAAYDQQRLFLNI